MCDTPGHHHHDNPLAVPRTARPEDRVKEFRVVLTGKGGVGKTTLTALLARLLARDAWRVLAIDADPQLNLPYALGLPRRAVRDLVPVGRNADYIEEKVGVRPGSGYGVFLRLNPDVDDVVDRFGVVGPDGVRLLVMGSTVQPAAGCLCPENTLLAAVANMVSLRPGEAILLDTQAGVEHFGRAIARGFRHAVVLTDPTFNGTLVALHGARLATELGIPFVHLVVNRVRAPEDLERVLSIVEEEGGFPFTSRHAVPWDPTALACEPGVAPLLDRLDSPLLEAAMGLRDALIGSEEELSRCAS